MLTSQTLETLSLHYSKKALDAYASYAGLRDDEKSFIKEFFPKPPARIIDLGVGSGRTTAPLQEMGYTVIGIEFCEDLVAFANRELPHVNIVQGDARRLDYENDSFDAAIFSWNGIDYMYPLLERFQVLREVKRIVKPGGIFLVSSHNALGCLGRLLRPTLLTKRAIRFWLDQFGSLSKWRQGYYRWRDDALGLPLFYSARPSVQRKQLDQCGWRVMAVRSVERPQDTASAVWDVHVQYVCKKPLAT
jgi:ubiquinone/menaquinone biosynthesis C-methylase UbiE